MGKFIFFKNFRSVILGRQAILSGDAKVVVAGGQESMSRSQHSAHLRDGVKFGDVKMGDTMLRDGLTDAFSPIHMGITGEEEEKTRLASSWENACLEMHLIFLFPLQLRTLPKSTT